MRTRVCVRVNLYIPDYLYTRTCTLRYKYINIYISWHITLITINKSNVKNFNLELLFFPLNSLPAVPVRYKPTKYPR